MEAKEIHNLKARLIGDQEERLKRDVADMKESLEEVRNSRVLHKLIKS